MSDCLLVERSASQIVTLTLNRPAVRNALDMALQRAFLAQIQALVGDPSLRVLIITGAGEEAFCAGGDLVELAEKTRAEDGAELAAVMGEALHLLERAPFPSIAALNGDAWGGGAELALACDLRVIDEGASMGLVQLRLGLSPGWGAGQRLLRLVGYSRALQLLLEAAPQDAASLRQLGLVNQVAPAGQALATALAMATTIARWDSAAVQAVKRLLWAGLLHPYDEARAIEQAAFPPLWAAEAHLAAVEQFLHRKRGNNELL